MENEFLKIFLAVLLANLLSLVFSECINLISRELRYSKRPKIVKSVRPRSHVPPSDEVLEQELDQQAEIMARALRIIKKQVDEKTDGEIDLDSPTG